jgi:preprotein translocase subunit SecD
VVLATLTTAIAASALTACGKSSDFDFRMYDARHQAKVEILISDVVRTSVRADRVPGNPPVVYFKLTDRGESKFRHLTRILAKRGKRLHTIERMAIEVNGKVYDRIGIDYEVFPDGLDAGNGLEILSFDDLATARRLANEMRMG